MRIIAVIDDDVAIGDMLEEVLLREGYAVVRAYSGTEALYLLSEKRVDLILLDLMLPGLSGEEVVRKIQGIPTIIMSARSDTDIKVDLLSSGAVDYVTKPFDTKELLARIAVQFRNTDRHLGDRISAGDLTLDESAHEARLADKIIKLTRTEYAILKLLMINRGQVISKSKILDRISLDTPDCTEYSLKMHISNLRKKLREVSDKEYIESIWGIGFKLI